MVVPAFGTDSDQRFGASMAISSVSCFSVSLLLDDAPILFFSTFPFFFPPTLTEFSSPFISSSLLPLFVLDCLFCIGLGMYFLGKERTGLLDLAMISLFCFCLIYLPLRYRVISFPISLSHQRVCTYFVSL